MYFCWEDLLSHSGTLPFHSAIFLAYNPSAIFILKPTMISGSLLDIKKSYNQGNEINKKILWFTKILSHEKINMFFFL